MPTVHESLIRLRQNWDKGLTPNIKASWIPEIESGGWTERDVERAVTRCIRDKTRVHVPQSFGEFSVYLPPRRVSDPDGSASLGWWGNEGEWGGDWSNSSAEHMLEPAATMLAFGDNWRKGAGGSIRRFIELAVQMGCNPDAIQKRADELKELRHRQWAHVPDRQQPQKGGSIAA